MRAMFVLGMAGFFNDFAMPAAWAGAMDIGGRYAGHGVGRDEHVRQPRGRAVADGRRIPAGDDQSGNWTLTFYISSGIYLIGGFCWFCLDSHTPLEQG